MLPPWIAFLAWLPISLYCFWRYSVRTALLINFFAGWAVLPGACYVATPAVFPYWILGGSLPTDYFFTKGSVTGIACLIGLVMFGRSSPRHLKLSLWDIPMLVWCAAPALSAIANSQDLALALRSELYQCLAWGVPYFAGRFYFRDTESLELLARAIVLAGLAYVPICIGEVFTGPQLYVHLYGYEPYRWVGAQRYIGFRPVGLLEDGNQLGMWMASSALIAVWLWRHRVADSIARVPIAWAAAILFAVTLLCQSAGSIVLLVCLLSFAFVRRTFFLRTLALLLVAVTIGAVGLRLLNVVSLRAIVEHNRAAYEIARALKEMKLGTFGWRLSQDEQHVAIALRKPIFGSGQWDWWRPSASRPWSLWLLSFGMYGLVGLLALQCLQLAPVARTWRTAFSGSNVVGLELRTALAAVVLMAAADNLLNGSMILPLVLIIGGLSGPETTSVQPASTRKSLVTAFR